MGPVRTSHILLKVGNGITDKESYDAICEIRDAIKQGQTTFAQMAKEYSECPSGSKGGDLGYFGPGTMVKPFEDASYSLTKSHPTTDGEPVKTQFGYHLIELTGRVMMPLLLRRKWRASSAYRQHLVEKLNTPAGQ
ncbi:peptidyl-prolyl cis-trans isomerase [bacterium]|nr:peptidyl-prolyl cis-trans isomerase [bacterium]